MKIIWSPTARNKTKEILEYISEDNPDAALALIDLIEEKVENLSQNPESGRVFPPTNNDKIREIVFHENYGVIYEVNDDQVEIIPQDEGLLIKKVDAKSAYQEVSEKHRKSLDKLGE